MSVKKFRFVSPGIFINEIDQSQLPVLPARMGPVIIGRSERGPGFIPTTVHSYTEFVEIFGNPIPGGVTNDVWRNGNYNAPTYGAYAAQAYLKNNNPVTFVRLLGAHHDNNDSTTAPASTIGNHAEAGWRTTNLTSQLGGAYGLFVMSSGSTDATTIHTGTLAAVWYLDDGYMWLSGALRGTETGSADGVMVSGSSVLLGNTGELTWKAIIKDSSHVTTAQTSFSFDPDSDNYIRKVFNTSPQLVNTNIYNSKANNGPATNYWLGESFDRSVQDTVSSLSTSAGEAFGVILQLSLIHI